MDWPQPLTQIKNVVAIVGCQRSGTTLVGQLFGACRTALLIDEFDGLYPWFHALRDAAPEAAGLTDDLLRRVGSKYRDERVKKGVHGATFALASQVDTLVLKAPNLTYDPEVLADLPVPVTIVYPLRDPRAVVASMLRLEEIDFVGNQTRLIAERPLIAERYKDDCARLVDDREPLWVRQAVLWRIKTGRAPDFEDSGLSVRAFRYEDLVREPEETLRPILEASGLPDIETALTAHGVYVGTGPGGTDRTRALDTSSLLRWHHSLDALQAKQVLAEAQPLARQLDYA